MQLDPVAVYAAIVSTIVALHGLLANRTRLRCVASIDWPNATPRPESHSGVDLGEPHVRIDITNEGRRPTTVIRAGFVLTYDERPRPLEERVRGALMRFTSRVAPAPRRFIGFLPITPAGKRKELRLDEFGTWSESRRAAEVAFDSTSYPRGATRVIGAYAQLISGRVVYWTPDAARCNRVIRAMKGWKGGFEDAYPQVIDKSEVSEAP